MIYLQKEIKHCSVFTYHGSHVYSLKAPCKRPTCQSIGNTLKLSFKIIFFLVVKGGAPW